MAQVLFSKDNLDGSARNSYEAVLRGLLIWGFKRLQPGYNYVGQTNDRQPLHIKYCGQVA
jgi:hypothetical protein